MKNEKVKKKVHNHSKKNNIHIFCENKVTKYQEIIEKTIIIVQKNKTHDIIGVSELNACIQNLEVLFNELEELYNLLQHRKIKEYNNIINRLQKINNELSILFRSFGTEKIEDLISICFGQDFIQNIITKKNEKKI